MIKNWNSFNESRLNKPTEEELENLRVLKDVFQEYEDDIDTSISYIVVISDENVKYAYDINGKLIEKLINMNNETETYYAIRPDKQLNLFLKSFEDCLNRAESLGFRYGGHNMLLLVKFYI